jgi:hypothetical protein
VERVGAVVDRHVTLEAEGGEGHVHTAELQVWPLPDDRAPAGGGSAAALDDLVVACVAAAVVAPEREVGRWLSWPVGPGDVSRLVGAGRLARVDGHLALP